MNSGFTWEETHVLATLGFQPKESDKSVLELPRLGGDLVLDKINEINYRISWYEPENRNQIHSVVEQIKFKDFVNEIRNVLVFNRA